jgi:hypothetical protein
MGFDITDQLLIRYLQTSDTGEKNWCTMIRDTVHQLFINFKKAYPATREVLYEIVI